MPIIGVKLLKYIIKILKSQNLKISNVLYVAKILTRNKLKELTILLIIVNPASRGICCQT